MMIAEIGGGLVFGSIALVADGLHMSTHAGALLLTALAYTYARKHAQDQKFTFGTGKLGDLAGFTSAIILAMIALLIGYESFIRFLAPVPIRFTEAIPIACAGLAVNIVSVWLLSDGGHHHSHSHGHSHKAHANEAQHQTETSSGRIFLEVFEDGVPPRFRIRRNDGLKAAADEFFIETLRRNGVRQKFNMKDCGAYIESIEEIPEPHEFTAFVHASGQIHELYFEEHAHGSAQDGAHRDNNMRAALIHVVADAAVSMLVIIGLLLAFAFNWLWMDPLVGTIGACVIANWAYGLVRDTSAILLDVNPDSRMATILRQVIESDGDELADLHLWRLGPGHLGAIISVITKRPRDADYYHKRLAHFSSLSHLTVEISRSGPEISK
jgi:cation diffusion facilitator family transporter